MAHPDKLTDAPTGLGPALADLLAFEPVRVPDQADLSLHEAPGNLAERLLDIVIRDARRAVSPSRDPAMAGLWALVAVAPADCVDRMEEALLWLLRGADRRSDGATAFSALCGLAALDASLPPLEPQAGDMLSEAFTLLNDGEGQILQRLPTLAP